MPPAPKYARLIKEALALLPFTLSPKCSKALRRERLSRAIELLTLVLERL
jgi:hypothetical protein